MRARIFLLTLTIMILSNFHAAEAQQPKKVVRMGYLTTRSAPSFPRSFRDALHDLGYIEGQNLVIEYRYGQGKQDRYFQLAAELVRRKVDIIVVVGGDILVHAAKDATQTIPIIMSGGGLDPVEAGLVESLAHPDGNVTGVTNLSRRLGGKRLELLKQAVPKVARVAVLYDSRSNSAREVKEDLPVAARSLGLTVLSWQVRQAGDFEKIFHAISQQRVDGLYVPARGPLINANHKRIADFALKSRIPSIYSYRNGVDDGGFMYYGADGKALFRRVASYVDRIVKGAKPADLPVEQPTKFEFVINLKTARQIGVTISPNVLARADKVIK
jgi:putative ABC transport system substrate-binding protein